jgi:inner membrane protein
MTGRTHDLAAFTALSFIMATNPLPSMTLGTAIVAFSANMIGGLAPDIDQPTADLWRRIPAGSIVGRIIYPILGGHRFISHSILGVFIFGFVVKYFLQAASGVLVVDRDIVWTSFMIGFISHLFVDMLTRDGVPWLFPIPIKLGIPPFRALRIKTGGMVEKSILFPGLMLANGLIYYSNYQVFLDFIRNHIK